MNTNETNELSGYIYRYAINEARATRDEVRALWRRRYPEHPDIFLVTDELEAPVVVCEARCKRDARGWDIVDTDWIDGIKANTALEDALISFFVRYSDLFRVVVRAKFDEHDPWGGKLSFEIRNGTVMTLGQHRSPADAGVKPLLRFRVPLCPIASLAGKVGNDCFETRAKELAAEIECTTDAGRTILLRMGVNHLEDVLVVTLFDQTKLKDSR